MTKTKRKPGRPPVPKDKQGRMVWIPGRLLENFKAWLETEKTTEKAHDQASTQGATGSPANEWGLTSTL